MADKEKPMLTNSPWTQDATKKIYQMQSMTELAGKNVSMQAELARPGDDYSTVKILLSLFNHKSVNTFAIMINSEF